MAVSKSASDSLAAAGVALRRPRSTERCAAANAASKSFGVDLKARQADSQIIAMQVTGTPTLVVNGKYRLNNEHQMSADQIIELVKFLVAKETK